MSKAGDAPATGWQRLDKAAFGIIYGAVMVLSILLAQGGHPAPALETAVVLFGSVLAITLAKAFAEFLGHALQSRERMTRHSWRAAWQHSTPTLAVANVPTALFLAAWQDWIAGASALVISQVFLRGRAGGSGGESGLGSGSSRRFRNPRGDLRGGHRCAALDRQIRDPLNRTDNDTGLARSVCPGPFSSGLPHLFSNFKMWTRPGLV